MLFDVLSTHAADDLESRVGLIKPLKGLSV